MQEVQVKNYTYAVTEENKTVKWPGFIGINDVLNVLYNII